MFKTERFECEVYTLFTIELSKSQWVLSDKRFNSFWHVFELFVLVTGFLLVLFCSFFSPPDPPVRLQYPASVQVAFNILLINETEHFKIN